MLALVQRVALARVEVAGRVTGEIGRGLLVFVCAGADLEFNCAAFCKCTVASASCDCAA